MRQRLKEDGEGDVKDNPPSPRFHPNRAEINAIHPLISIFRFSPCALWLRYACSVPCRWRPFRHQSLYRSSG
jgi:hypothetical protein